MPTDEFDQLLLDRFNLSRSDLIPALKTLPAQRPWAARLTESEARLLDDAGFTEDPDAYRQIAADVIAQLGRLYSTAYTANEVKAGLGISDSRVRQRRLDHTLWAINDDGNWVYPSIQFETISDADDNRLTPTPLKLKQVRGLSEVLLALLAHRLHPTAVAGFLITPQHELLIDGHPTAVRDWLLHGEAIEPVLQLIEIGDWAAT